MNNKIKTTYATFIIMAIAVVSLYILSNLDAEISWFMPLGIILIIPLVLLAIFDLKKFILLTIILIPTVFSFNQFKINISDLLPIIDGYSIYLNPASIFYLFISLTGIIVIISHWQKFKKIPLKNIILIYSFYALISILWSGQKNTSLIELIYLIVPFFIYFISYLYFGDKNSLIKIFFASLLSSIIPVIIAIKQIVNKEYFFEPDSSLGRIIGTFTHPNSLGLYLFLIIALIIIYLISEEKKLRENKIIISYGLVLSSILLLTYSRTSWVALIVFIIILLFTKNKLAIFLSIISPLVASLLLLIESIRYRVMEIFNYALYNSWRARLNIWKIAANEIIKKPLLGHGIGTSENIIEKAKTWRGGTSLPHNDYILETLELGIIGLIMYLSVNFSALYYTYKAYLSETDQMLPVNIYSKKINLNFKIITFGIFSLSITLLLSGMMESTSQKIVIQIILWSILGSLLAQSKEIKP